MTKKNLYIIFILISLSFLLFITREKIYVIEINKSNYLLMNELSIFENVIQDIQKNQIIPNVFFNKENFLYTNILFYQSIICELKIANNNEFNVNYLTNQCDIHINKNNLTEFLYDDNSFEIFIINFYANFNIYIDFKKNNITRKIYLQHTLLYKSLDDQYFIKDAYCNPIILENKIINFKFQFDFKSNLFILYQTKLLSILEKNLLTQLKILNTIFKTHFCYENNKYQIFDCSNQNYTSEIILLISDKNIKNNNINIFNIYNPKSVLDIFNIIDENDDNYINNIIQFHIYIKQKFFANFGLTKTYYYLSIMNNNMHNLFYLFLEDYEKIHKCYYNQLLTSKEINIYFLNKYIKEDNDNLNFIDLNNFLNNFKYFIQS